MSIANVQQRLSKLLTLVVIGSCLAACGGGSAPEKSWEVAVKGTYSAAISDDGKLGIVGSITHGASLWKVPEGERLFSWNHKQGEYTNIVACGFSPEGRFALTADSHTMVLWSTETGKALTYWTAPSEVLSVDLTPNGNYALLGLGDFTAVVFDVKRGGIERTFHHENRVRSVSLSNDGQRVLTGSEDQTATLWNLQSEEALFSWQHEAEVVLVALSPAGDKALTVAKYDKAVIWNTQTGEALGELPLRASAIKRGQAFTSAAFSQDGTLLLTGNSDQTVQLWDTNSLQQLEHWQVPKRDAWKPTSAAIAAVGFSERKNRYYAIASNGFIHQLSRQ